MSYLQIAIVYATLSFVVQCLSHDLTGYKLARTPLLNKGHSYTAKERNDFDMRGLYPAGDPISLDSKVDIALSELRKKTSPLEKYIYLHTIQDSDETLFYAILIRHTKETMPLVYTPTVGEACQQWGRIYRHTPRGLYLSSKDKGQIRKILDNHPNKDVKVVVFTDGERILGLGDLGVNGMGIPIGKLALYTACAGIPPSQCLPVQIDVGTERAELRGDVSYMGLRQPRDRSAAYDELIQEFFDACQDAYGRSVLMQFEDFGNSNAFRLLDHHRNSACVFNDDIQGTASVVLAGIIASLPLAKKSKVGDHTFLFYGAGEAGVGIANLVVSYIQKEAGVSAEEARKRVWLVDSKGIVSASRTDELAHHKQPYAHPLPQDTGGAVGGAENNVLLRAVKLLRPTAIIGVSAQGASFTQEICEEMSSLNPVSTSGPPLIFALSNPTSKAECSAKQAYEWTNGNCVFASGSPFDPVTLPDGRHFVPGQGNNAYIFPGVGLGAIVSGAQTLTDDDFSVAASSLAQQVTADQLEVGCAYPPLADIRSVSLKIAADVAQNIIQSGRGTSALQSYDDILASSKAAMYEPSY